MRLIYTLGLILCTVIHCSKIPKQYVEPSISSRFKNINFIQDRFKYEIRKPFINETWEKRYSQPFSPVFMDYCNPYHCNAYHRAACGLNRRKMRFKWFQSGCHIILNNMCSIYRGNLKYDMIESKFCHKYVMFLRVGCPMSCDEEELNPVCAVSGIDNHVVVFRSRCAFDAAYCRNGMIQEYEEVNMELCIYYLENK